VARLEWNASRFIAATIRALVIEINDECHWFWIGSVADYDRLIG
jgi:hypothetical protein